MRKTILAFSLLVPAIALAADFATCLLDKLPDVQNDNTANAVHQFCMQKHPGGLEAVKQGSGRGFLGFESGAECAIKKGSGTQSQRAGQLIWVACRKLYNEPEPDWENGVITSPKK